MAKFLFRNHEPRLATDTVVFVHGLIGDIVKTWGRFPELLRTDPDLPKLDVLMCGYQAFSGDFTRLRAKASTRRTAWPFWWRFRRIE